MSIRMRVNAARFYKRCALKIYRAPENRSEARFLGKRSGRRSGQGGKRSAPPAMAPWRDEAQRGETAASTPRNFARRRMAGFPLHHGNFFRRLERNFVNRFARRVCGAREGSKRSYPRCLPAAASSNISTILSMHFPIWKRSAYSIYCSRSAARSSGCSII